jgi:NAD-dependent dihydropyrimidine dehydrogenase PreA subunit
LGRRFWCRCLCPAGGLLSLLWPLRLIERRVDDACVACGQCAEACDFDAVADDYATRPGACTSCQSCARVCPTRSIRFVNRLASPGHPEAQSQPRPGRRGLLVASVTGATAAIAARLSLSATRAKPALLRPPGSVPEEQFLDLCVRCGLCMQVCPGPVLHPASLEAGLEAMWTPVVVPTRAGCHQDCNFCTQVCPTRAIRPLSLHQKRAARIGLAKVDRAACLAHTGRQDCRLCYDECSAAGYDAIEMRSVPLELGDIPEGTVSEMELEEMSRIDAPFVRADACVGCGLCEFRCPTEPRAIAVVPHR